MSSGYLQEKYSFQKRVDADDGHGNPVADWEDKFTMRGGRKFFRGIEKVVSAASTGTQKMIVKVRSCADVRLVTTGWRVVDVRSGETYNILAKEPSRNRQYVEFIVESGGPDG